MANKKPQTRTQRRAKTIDDFPTIDEIIEKDINDKTETEFPVKKVIQFIPILIIIILLFVAGSANSKYNKMKTEINGYKTKIVNLTDKKKEYEELIESYKERLADGEEYIVYVTLNEVMNYHEFVNTTKMLSVSPYWVGICAKNNDKDYGSKPYISNHTTGFIYNTACKGLAFDKEKYPYLTQYSVR